METVAGIIGVVPGIIHRGHRDTPEKHVSFVSFVLSKQDPCWRN